jgi:hypothetical protein
MMTWGRLRFVIFVIFGASHRMQLFVERCFSFVRAVSQRCDESAWGMSQLISPTQLYHPHDNLLGVVCSSCDNDEPRVAVPCANVLGPVPASDTAVLPGVDLCDDVRDVPSPMWSCMGVDDGQGVESVQANSGPLLQRSAIACPECGCELFDSALTSSMAAGSSLSSCVRSCSCGAAVSLVFSSASAYMLVANVAFNSSALI